MKQYILNTIRSLIFALSLIALAYTSVSSASDIYTEQKKIKYSEQLNKVISETYLQRTANSTDK